MQPRSVAIWKINHYHCTSPEEMSPHFPISLAPLLLFLEWNYLDTVVPLLGYM